MDELPQSVSVLVVDDDALIVKLLRRALDPPHRVCTETCPERALGLLETEAVDIILCDMRMPAMTGLEFRRRTVAARPELERRFVFVTGAHDLELGDAVVLVKPFSLARLREVVATFIASGNLRAA